MFSGRDYFSEIFWREKKSVRCEGTKAMEKAFIMICVDTVRHVMRGSYEIIIPSVFSL